MRRLTLARQQMSIRMRRRDDEGVALLSALLFMVLVAGLSVVLLSVILSQAMPVYTAQKSTKTVYSAQAGLQAALGVVRSLSKTDITTGKITGLRANLPCTISGKVDGSDATSTYSVTMKYFMADPTGKDSTWQNANDMDCTGTVLPGTSQPLYALAQADGLGAAIPGMTDATIGDRHISAVYKFKVTNVNIAGGRIYDYGNTYCLQATSATVGSQITLKAPADCKSANDSTQLWVYDKDYEIKLASTLVAGQSPLCITSPTNTTNTAALAGSATLTACKSDASRWTQLWSWVGSNTWVGQNSTNTSNTNFCLSPGAIAAGSVLAVRDGCSGGFSPSTAVGAGAASALTFQMVNYKEFGRCADVTDQVVTSSFMISYPCKQDPTGTGTQLLWNHKWYYTEPVLPATSVADQAIYVYNGGTKTDSNKYCLTAPASSGKFVTFTLCSNPLATSQKWTRFLDTGTYSTSYVFVDKSTSRCLSVDATDTYTAGKWSKMIMAACNGGLEQKWNAPASYTDSDVSSYREYSK
ncbi:hypothetical protein [Lacisediminihabitans changchengi]|uniref:Ricin B lectin domain-containing protein n=1 Tax=Lacisediminihabitans changchengi TaxID=2787634 RepID=A0A934SNS6_9MICO|nr:hypothetical protein [Lacisediminihabitans changchengi]MBK4348417.1 hypothetical protein [Lacisediminihabitans changchengi]